MKETKMRDTTAITVAASNTAQVEAWDGDEGAYWAEHAEYFDRSIAPYHDWFLSKAGIRAGSRVLDLGCGTGETTLDAARSATQGAAVGIDLSSRMLDVARQRASEHEIPNVEFLHADAQVHPFDAAAFDVVISRTGAMFFGEPDAAWRNVARAMTPGGRLALLTWQPLGENEWVTAFMTALAGPEAPLPPPNAGPSSPSDPDHVRGLFEPAGVTDIERVGRKAPMWFGTDADDAHRFILGLMGWTLREADEAGRERAVRNLRDTMVDHETADGVLFRSGAWVITARNVGAGD